MNRRLVGILVIAALGILAISLSAATLDETVTTGTGGGGGAEGPLGPNLPDIDSPDSLDFLVLPFPRELVIAGLVLVALSVIYYAWTNPLELAGTLAVIFIIAVIALVILSLIDVPASPREGPAFNQSRANGTIFGGGEGPGSGAAADITTVQPPELLELLIVLVLGVTFIGVVLSLYRVRDAAEGSGADEAEETAVDMDAIGQAAGRAADRLEADADVDNEVYRAWREMTDLLEVPHPDSSTAGDFAAAAVDAGMAPEDVAQLTRVFEEVRYGGADPSGDREQRAIDAFHRIEAAYED